MQLRLIWRRVSSRSEQQLPTAVLVSVAEAPSSVRLSAGRHAIPCKANDLTRHSLAPLGQRTMELADESNVVWFKSRLVALTMKQTHNPAPRPIRGVGKRGRQWLAFRRRYLAGRRNHEGYYECSRCRRWVARIELHHLRKRSLAPERVLDPANVRMLCGGCHRAAHNAPRYSVGPDVR